MFSERQLRVLDAICCTIFPSVPNDRISAITELAVKRNLIKDNEASRETLGRFLSVEVKDLGALVAAKLTEIIRQPQLNQLKLVLNLLSTSVGTFLLSGCKYWKAVDALEIGQREQLLLRWKNSSITQIRMLFKLFYKFTMIIVYGRTAPAVESNDKSFRSNSLWEAMGFPGESELKRSARKSLLSPISDHQLSSHYDAVIIGSGPGGSVAAKELATAGYRVLVLEKGQLFDDPEQMSFTEEQAFGKMFENGGMLLSEDGSISLMAGSVVGGGSTVNWSASLATPPDVREEWAEKYGLTEFNTSAFDDALKSVCTRLGVGTSAIKHNSANQVLLDGCKTLDYPADDIPQNTAAMEHGCGMCGLGCPTLTKQSSWQTYLNDACAAGAHLLTGCRVQRINVKQNQDGPQTVELGCLLQTADNSAAPLTIQSNIAVVSAGSVNTPAVLLRSGFRNPNIGKNLRLHPVTVCIGRFAEQVNQFNGSIMTSISTVADKSPVDGANYGVKLEVPVIYPTLAQAAVPPQELSNDDEMHQVFPEAPVFCSARLDALKLSHYAAIIALDRDRDSDGRVTIDKNGNPLVSYALSSHDSIAIAEGLVYAARVLAVQGAREITTTIETVPTFRFSDGDDCKGVKRLEDPSFIAFCRSIRDNAPRPPHNITLLSAHQMGSCRLGVDASSGACRPTGQLWECENVWVCDGSLLPTASGVNPMISIYTTCTLMAKHMRKWMDENKTNNI